MQFHANHVSNPISGDYYRALFEYSEDASGSRQSVSFSQRQFEDPDCDQCCIETHDKKYIGNFRLRRIEFAGQ